MFSKSIYKNFKCMETGKSTRVTGDVKQDKGDMTFVTGDARLGDNNSWKGISRKPNKR